MLRLIKMTTEKRSLKTLPVEGVQHGVSGPICHGGGAVGLAALAVLVGLAAERPLVDLALGGAGEGHAWQQRDGKVIMRLCSAWLSHNDECDYRGHAARKSFNEVEKARHMKVDWSLDLWLCRLRKVSLSNLRTHLENLLSRLQKGIGIRSIPYRTFI